MSSGVAVARARGIGFESFYFEFIDVNLPIMAD